MKNFKDFITEAVFDDNSIKGWLKELDEGINAPVVKTSVSDLGGTPTIMCKFSLDDQKDWKGGIFQNSRYANLRIDVDGTLEMFQVSSKVGIKGLRKSKIKSAKDAIKKINTWIGKA
tara:strand:- start:509 stop:859 length:351 start_codon:yes stop_codon:yes gene_type:complete